MTEIPPEAHISYQFQYRRCGKCAACMEGQGHGPYFYAYWRVSGTRPQSKNMGKTLKAEIVIAYFRQVHRISPEEMSVHWQNFKQDTLQASVPDELLTQQQLRTLAMKCKEKCRRPQKASSCETTLVLQPQASVA